MKLIYNNRYIKQIPKSLCEVINPELYIEDESKKRLNRNERRNLETALFSQRIEQFIEEKRKHPGINEYLGTDKPICAVEVRTRAESYYAIQFPRNKLLKCSFSEFAASPLKNVIFK